MSIPAALAALTATVTAEFAGEDDTRVVDGPPTQATDLNMVCIGYNPAGPAITLAQSLGGPALAGQRQAFDVANRIAVWQGGDDADNPTVRALVFDLFDRIRGCLTADKTLGGEVAQAVIVGADYTPEQAAEGVAAALDFTIRIEAFTN